MRAKLAGWQAVMNEVRDDEEGNADYIFHQIIPYIARTGVSTGHGGKIIYGDWPIATASIIDDLAVTEQLWSDAEFRALLDVRYAFLLHAMQEYDAAYQAAEDILLEIANDGNP